MEFIKEHWPFFALGALLLILFIVLIVIATKQRKQNKEAERKEQELVKIKSQKRTVKPILKTKANNTKENNQANKNNQANLSAQKTEVVSKPATKNEQSNKDYTKIKEEENMKKEVKKEVKQESETYRVVYDKEQKNWIVRIDGGQRASKRCATKEEALKVAKDLARKKDADLSIHKKNGKFQKI